MDITPDMVLAAYAQGFFPMAAHRQTKELHWFSPDPRAILPLDTFHIPRSLIKCLKQGMFEVTINTRFTEVITACATVPRAQNDSWINAEIIELYTSLHEKGYAHSVECWQSQKLTGGQQLVGGLYGISLAGAFFGESMFSRVSNASKVALVHLVGRLRSAGYSLLDVQYSNPHLIQFGVQELPRAQYQRLLENALNNSSNPSSRFLTASPIMF